MLTFNSPVSTRDCERACRPPSRRKLQRQRQTRRRRQVRPRRRRRRCLGWKWSGWVRASGEVDIQAKICIKEIYIYIISVHLYSTYMCIHVYIDLYNLFLRVALAFGLEWCSWLVLVFPLRKLEGWLWGLLTSRKIVRRNRQWLPRRSRLLRPRRRNLRLKRRRANLQIGWNETGPSTNRSSSSRDTNDFSCVFFHHG